MKLIRLNLLKHIESFSEKRVANMRRKMETSGIWEKPISVERNHMLILDGQHRYEVARGLKLTHIPCELFDYEDEDLLVWSLRKECDVSKQLVIERSLSGNIYPYKTAKHKFPRTVEKVMIPLEDLRRHCKDAEQDIVAMAM